ncbi:MAG TPA: hypothetical protein VGA87_11690, partial [Pyrinomonadaceae bacterium]
MRAYNFREAFMPPHSRLTQLLLDQELPLPPLMFLSTSAAIRSSRASVSAPRALTSAIRVLASAMLRFASAMSLLVSAIRS